MGAQNEMLHTTMLSGLEVASHPVPSKYGVETCLGGVRVSAPHRRPATILCTGHSFIVFDASLPAQRAGQFWEEEEDVFGITCPRSAEVGLFQFPTLLCAITDVLLRDVDCGRAFWMRKWLSSCVSRALAKRVQAQWAACLATLDPRALAAHRAVHAATLRWTPLASAPAFLGDRYLLSDVLRYRAAAAALVLAPRILPDHTAQMLETSPEAQQLRARAANLGSKVRIRAWPVEPTDEAIVAALPGWRGWFSPTGQPYRALNCTLDALSPAIPLGVLRALRNVRLERPLLRRSEVLFVGAFADGRGFRLDDFGEACSHVVLQAKHEQICEALTRVGAATRRTLSARRTKDLAFLIRFLFDWPGTPRGTLVGWADAAIRHHRCQLEGARAETLQRYGAERHLAEPPIPLPGNDAIRYLGTVGDVVDEGSRMQHCVANYVTDAMRGHAFLFHVTQRGEHATVMVGTNGVVLDAEGPRNCTNGAVRWGTRQLRAWGARLRAPVEAAREQAARDRGVLGVPTPEPLREAL